MAEKKLVTEALALGRLGERRFLAAERVVSAWNKVIQGRRTSHSIAPLEISSSQPVRYTEETLTKVVEDPAWCLYYDPGFSLRDNREIIGTDPSRQTCHRLDNDWWYREREDYWAKKREEPGYHLVRMEGVFQLSNPAQDWEWQEVQIKQMGELFQRAPTRVIVNACVSFFLLNNEKYFVNYSVFGPERDSDWCYIVANWDEFGINLGHWLNNDWGGYWGADLRVCLKRKPDL
jgi:hypothetical protein